jgi:hypothetical protein
MFCVSFGGTMNDTLSRPGELPNSAYFENTIRRAKSAADQRFHRYVTFEHLLFVLLDDPDAVALLQTLGVDTALLRVAITDAINNRMGVLVSEDRRPATFSYKFDALMASASGDARLVGRKSIDGALALIAIMRDPDSNAADLLLRYGFDLRSALQAVASNGTHREPVAGPSPTRAALVPDPYPASPPPFRDPDPFVQTPAALEADRRMDAMLADVRGLLDRDDPEPRPVPVQPARQAPPLLPPEAPSPAGAAKPRKRQTAAKGPRLTDAIPQRFRFNKPATVELFFTKEEAMALETAGNGQGHTRTLTIRLLALEGGMVVENVSPETQWVFDRPSFLGEEPFGQWVWTVFPYARGTYQMTIAMTVRDIDSNGVAHDTQLPDQQTAVKVTRGFRRIAGGLVWTLTVFLLGALASGGALYALRALGKIPR